MENKREKIEKHFVKSRYFFGILKRFWLLILVFFTVGAMLGGVISYVSYSPEYTVTQVFTIKLVNNPSASTATVSDNQLSKTIPSLLSSDSFVRCMKPYMKESGVVGTFKVTSLESSNIFYLTAVSDSNEACLKIINDIQAHYGEIAKGVFGESVMKFMAPPSVSKLPSNAPNYATGALIGAVSMLVIVLAGFVIKTLATETVTSVSDIQKHINAPCLTPIHQVHKKVRSGDSKENLNKISLVVDDNADLVFRKEISALATNFENICKEKEYNSVLITSSVSGEGKSTVSLNLACELADRGKKVVIVDCDLRVPSVAGYLGISKIDVPLYDAILSGEYNCTVESGIKNLYLAGNVEGKSNAFEKIDINHIGALFDDLKKKFDYVIVDSPPVGIIGDAIQIGEIVDGFIYVVAYNSVSKNQILQSLSSLDESKCEMFGFVLNHVI